MSVLFFDTYGTETYGFGTYGGEFRPSDVGSFGEAVYEELEPYTYAEADSSFPLLKFVGATGQMLQDIDYLAHDDVAPWRKILSLDELPDDALPWLGQFIGVTVNPDYTPDQQRQQIRSHESWQRGTVAALRESVRHLLSDTRTVEIVERFPDAYSLEVNTYATETHADQTYQNYYDEYLTYEIFYEAWDTYRSAWLAIASNLIESTLNENKPAGLKLTYLVLPGSPGALNSYATTLIKHSSYTDLYITEQTYEGVYYEV